MDNTPLDGFNCKGDTKAIKVCGVSGMLSDSVYPTNVKVVA